MDCSPPLAGITVVSIEQAIAAPLCSRQLADLGARVIKIERRESGDFARDYDTRVKGLSSHFVWTNRSKESLTLDLKHNDAQQVLARLLDKADVFVQNLAPSAADRLGLDYDALRLMNPQLIVCNISGYGTEGPYANKKAYDLLVQAEAGLLSVTGTADETVKSGISIADIAAGTQAHGAILAAIIKRSKTGLGCKIDISMLEAMVEWMGFPLLYAYEGAAPPARSGADHASIYPYGAFTVGKDKVIMLGIQNEREWTDFCTTVLSNKDLLVDKRFSTNVARSENRDGLRALIQTQFSSYNIDVLSAKFDAAKIAYAFVNDMAAVWQHPQLLALKRMIETETPNGNVSSFLPPGNNNSFEYKLGGVPSLGQHTANILAELGFTEAEIAEFELNAVC